MKPMTQAEYCEKGGAACPSCHSSAFLSGGHVVITEGGAEQEIFCGECNAFWTDTYTLSGYADLAPPPKELT